MHYIQIQFKCGGLYLSNQCTRILNFWFPFYFVCLNGHAFKTEKKSLINIKTRCTHILFIIILCVLWNNWNTLIYRQVIAVLECFIFHRKKPFHFIMKMKEYALFCFLLDIVRDYYESLCNFFFDLFCSLCSYSSLLQ